MSSFSWATAVGFNSVVFFSGTTDKKSDGTDSTGGGEDSSRFMFDEMDGGSGGGSGTSSSSAQDPNPAARDVIAESIYGLIGELFDMRGVFKWVRKSLMTFVQITYGSTINRQIRDTVTWVTSEQMILYYLHAFKKAFWLNDKPKPAAAARTKEQGWEMTILNYNIWHGFAS